MFGGRYLPHLGLVPTRQRSITNPCFDGVVEALVSMGASRTICSSTVNPELPGDMLASFLILEQICWGMNTDGKRTLSQDMSSLNWVLK